MSEHDRIETTPAPPAGKRSPARWVLLALGLVALTVLAAQGVRGNAGEPQAPAEEQTATVQPPEAPPAEAGEAKETGEDAAIGESIKSLNELNRKAAELDGVFVFLAGDDEAKAKEAVAAIAKATTAIRELDVKLKAFTLAPGTPEYDNIARQLPPPSVIALAKGRGMTPVTGEISEDKLLQAFLAAASAGGCGTPGCTVQH